MLHASFSRICVGISLLLTLSVCACRSGGPETEPMIPLDVFEQIVTEMHLSHAFFQTKSPGTSVFWQDTIPYNTYIIERYGYTEAQFDSTMVYLCYHPAVYDKMYDRIINGLLAIEKAVKREADPPSVYFSEEHQVYASADSLRGMLYLEKELTDTGVYRIEADILLYPQDQSVYPHMSFWFVLRDSTDTPYREYITPSPRYPLAKNGRRTRYAFQKRLHQPHAKIQGYFAGDLWPQRDTLWYKAVDIYDAALLFYRDTLRTVTP